jgi:Tol biopolymer transport system component
MLSPSLQLPMFRPFRSGPSRALVLAMSLALGACDSAESPLSPAEDSPAPATEAAPTEAVAPDNALLLATSQRITFISYRDIGAPNLANGNVYKIDPLGHNEVRLTSSFDNDYAPSWSYDNKRIAMVRYRMVGNVGHSDIYVIDANGGNGHWVRPTQSPYDLFDPTWSPDGTHLVLTVWLSPNWYLARMDLATGNLQLISPGWGGIVGTRPAYDKTGQKIVYIGSKYNTVEQVNADGSGKKILYSSSVYVDHPTFSPDGKKIAFERGYVPGNTDICVKNLVDGVFKRLTFSTAADRNATWSPDGTKIAFMSERSGKAQIWTMNAATGGSLLRITQTTSAERYPSWSH